MQISDIKIKKVDNEDKVKAYVSFVFCNSLAIHNVRIIEGKNGLIVAMPSKKTSDGFKDVVHPINKQCRDQITKAILDEYQK